ncbi:unnamed protein product [Ophioblennius macclurei]
MVPVIAPLLLALLLPHRALLTTELQLRDRRSPEDTKQDSIKVIITDGCSSQGDSSDSVPTGKEIDLSPGSPLVLTHKIKLVPSGSGSGSGSCDCEAEFAALRERVESLEREVSALREKCGGPEGTCCTSKESKGPGCSIKPDPGECPNECSDQGRCVDGRCVCFPGFSGPDCGESNCPNNCNNKGRCVNGQCLCDPGFTGPDCSATGCSEDCGDHGRCVDGKCACDAGFSGPSCSDQSCPGNCNRRGRCVNGRCVCNPGFAGPDCSTKACPDNCNDRGRCVNGKCVCDSGFTGADCSGKSCPGNCNNKGRCVNGKCVCDNGFTGEDCSEKTCPDNCNDRGRCVNGKCVCDSGFSGAGCSDKSCPGNCNNRGRCVNGRCVCNSGFAEPDCLTRACPGNCNDRGRCVNGKCVCDSGFTGADCSEDACPGNCNNRGRCINGQCVCNDGFTGDDCSEKACPNNCNNRGKCVNGKCVCEVGFSGPDCSSKGCPNNCNGRGRCVKGACVCRRGFTGPDCSQCQEGKTGPNCDTVMSAVPQLSARDITETSATLVWTPPAVRYDAYHLTFSSQKEGDHLIPVKVDGGLTSFTQTGLAAGEEYTVTVVGELDGRRGAEASSTFRTLISGPSNLHVVKTSTTSAVVQWEESRGVIDKYILTVTPNDGVGRSQEINIPFGQNSAHIQQLEAGREYDVALVAKRGDSVSEPVVTQAVPGVSTAALTLQVTKAPGVDGDSNPRPAARVFDHQGRKAEDADSVRDKVPLTSRARMLINKATALNNTRVKLSGKPKVTGPSRFSSVRGGPDGKQSGPPKKDSAGPTRTDPTVPEQSQAGVLVERDPIASSSERRDDKTPAAEPETDSETSSSEGPTGSKEQPDVGASLRGNDTDPARPEPTPPAGSQEKKCMNKIKVTHLRFPLKDRGGKLKGLQEGNLNSDPGAPPSGDVDPFHKLLTDTFQSLNVTTFSMHLTEASNLSHDETTVKKQLLGGLTPLSPISSSSSDSSVSESSSSESLESTVEPSPSPSSPSIQQNSDSSGNNKPGVEDSKSTTDRKQPTLPGETPGVPYFRRTLPPKRGFVRRPHPNLDSSQNRTYPNMRAPQRFPPRPNPGTQTESPTSSSDSEDSSLHEVVASVNYPNENKDDTSTSSEVKQKIMLTDVLRPSPRDGSLRHPSLKVAPLQNRTQPNRRPFIRPSQPLNPETETQEEPQSVTSSPISSGPIDAGPVTEENEGTVGGRFSVNFNRTLREETPPSHNAPKKTGFFRRPQLYNGSAQNRTNLRFPQRGPIRKPVSSSKLPVGNRLGPGGPGGSPRQQGQNTPNVNQPGRQNVPGLTEQDQIRQPVEQDSPTTVSDPEEDGPAASVRPSNDLEKESNEETLTTKIQDRQTPTQSDPRFSRPVMPPKGQPPARTIEGEHDTLTYEHDSRIRSGTKELGQEDNEMVVSTGSDRVALEESTGMTAEGGSIIEEPHSKTFRPSTTRTDELGEGEHDDSTTTNINIDGKNIPVGGRLTPKKEISKPVRPFNPLKRQPPTTIKKQYAQTGSHDTRVRPQHSFVDTGSNEETVFKDGVNPIINTGATVKQPASGPSGSVRPINRKPPTRAGTGERLSQIESQHSQVKPETSALDLEDNEEAVSRGSSDADESTAIKSTPGIRQPDSRPSRPVSSLKRQPSTVVRTGEHHTQTGSHDTGDRSETRGVAGKHPGTRITGRPTLQDPSSRRVRPVIPPKRIPPTRVRTEEHHTPIDARYTQVRPETSVSGTGGSEEAVSHENEKSGSSFKIKPDTKPSRPAPPLNRVRTGGHHSQAGSHDTTVRPETGNEDGPDPPDQLTDGADIPSTVVRGGPTDSRATRPGPVVTPKKPLIELRHTPMRPQTILNRDRLNSNQTTKRPLGSKTAVSPASDVSSHGVSREPLDFVGVTNRTSDGFTLLWDSPEGKYKNFVVTRKVAEKDEESGGEEETEAEKHQPSKQDNRVPEGPTSKPTDNDQTFKTVVPGSARSFQFQDLVPKTDYTLTLLGKGPGILSRLHKLVISTGPEPPTDIVFSKVTEKSLTVSWTKPKSPVSGFKVTYTHADNGEPVSVSVDSEDSSLGLSQLAPGSSYEVSIISTLGLDESDPLKEFVMTRPDPPTDLRAVNVSDSSALLLWRPALAAVDKYAIVYGAGTASELRITVTGNTAEQQLGGLEGSTTYTVTISGQLGDMESSPVTTSFTTTGSGSGKDGVESQDLRASNVSPRTATLSWKPPSQPVDRYKLTYQTESGEVKEVFVDAALTQFNLTKLRPGSSYSAQLQGERQGRLVSESSTKFTTGTLKFPFPTDCSQELLNGIFSSGEVDIFPGGEREPPLTVYCDLETDGGGWTVFQRRKDGSEDFFRGWKEYVRGFGDVNGEFWLGLDSLNQLTTMTPMTLRVDLRDADEAVYAQYSTFEVGKRHYRLTVGGYSGTAGDSFSYHNNRIFSTRDRDPGTFVTRCAMSYRGGWWYKNCHEANLNGLYGITERHQGVVWTSWKGKEFSIPFTEMKMRPTSFRPPARG